MTSKFSIHYKIHLNICHEKFKNKPKDLQAGP